VRLESTVADDLPPVAADRHRVLQVLQNLIGNALKFVATGGAITLSADRQGDFVRVSVADTGVGIAADDLAKVFDRFWRANRSEGGGAGLGLAVAKGIVEAHGGRIGVQSQLARAPLFISRCPCTRAHRSIRSKAGQQTRTRSILRRGSRRDDVS
jgi:signal transduction histidine kinase